MQPYRTLIVVNAKQTDLSRLSASPRAAEFWRRQGRDRDRRNKTASPAEESRVRAAHKHHSRTSPVLLYLDGKGLEQGELRARVLHTSQSLHQFFHLVNPLLYAFFSHIREKLLLQQIIAVLLEGKKKKRSLCKESLISEPEKYQISHKIWELYKHTDTLRKEKEASRERGNHVRTVIQPMETRLNKKIEKLQNDMKEIKQSRQEEMKKMTEKMDLILELLQKTK